MEETDALECRSGIRAVREISHHFNSDKAYFSGEWVVAVPFEILVRINWFPVKFIYLRIVAGKLVAKKCLALSRLSQLIWSGRP